MQIRRVGIWRGWQWVKEGFRLFLRNPLLWIVMSLLLMTVTYLLGLIPVVGGPMVYLLSPIPVAGMMAGCRDLELGRPLSINHLLSGFRDGAGDLVTLGGIFLVARILIVALVTQLADVDMQALARSSAGFDPRSLPPEVASRIAGAVAVGMMLIVPVALLLWYAPTLIILDGVPAGRAALLSLRACLMNLLPTLVYSTAMTLFFLLVMITLGFGIFIWLPLAIASTYRAYRDIFQQADAAQEPSS